MLALASHIMNRPVDQPLSEKASDSGHISPSNGQKRVGIGIHLH
jgi:hypothetical protein